MDDQNQINPCNPDDVACNEEVLARLKEIQTMTKEDGFEQKNPHLTTLAASIDELVEAQEVKVQQSVDACGLPSDTSEDLSYPENSQDLSQYFTEE